MEKQNKIKIALVDAQNKPIKPNAVYVFIDASNLWQAQKSKGKMFDYEKLKIFLKAKFNASEIQIFYYTAYPAEGTRDYNLDSKHKFLTYLKRGLGFIVRKKELKRIFPIITPNISNFWQRNWIWRVTQQEMISGNQQIKYFSRTFSLSKIQSVLFYHHNPYLLRKTSRKMGRTYCIFHEPCN